MVAGFLFVILEQDATFPVVGDRGAELYSEAITVFTALPASH